MNSNTETPPTVLVLGPITPTDEGAHLRYEKLGDALELHRPFESTHWRDFLEQNEDSIEEDDAARRLASYYLLECAGKQTTALTADQRKIWADRYTQASSELYGTPDILTTKSLMRSEASEFSKLIGNPSIDQDLLSKVLSVYEIEPLEEEGDEHEITSNRLVNPSLAVREVLNEQYATLFELFENQEVFAPEDIADRFRQALIILASSDSTWNEWTIVVAEDKDSLSVIAPHKRIIVGAKRTAATKEEIKGLFAHEVLVHAQRSVNGRKVSEEFATGLPGYLDFEEGLGVFFEYAKTGIIPQKNIDRYIDVSLALGLTNGQPMPRSAMLEFVYSREMLRAQAKTEQGEAIDEEKIQKKVRAHVNRIYRGTTGDDEAIGVFSKDFVYYEGFRLVAEYVASSLAEGRDIREVIAYLLQGKFNPYSRLHTDYIDQHQVSK